MSASRRSNRVQVQLAGLFFEAVIGLVHDQGSRDDQQKLAGADLFLVLADPIVGTPSWPWPPAASRRCRRSTAHQRAGQDQSPSPHPQERGPHQQSEHAPFRAMAPPWRAFLGAVEPSET